MQLLILIVFFISYQAFSLTDFKEQPYKKVIPNLDPQAKCLDGSPGGLYFHQGTQKRNFLIFLIGGGYCSRNTMSQSIESCWQRSKTMLGSSTLYPDQIIGQGLLSTDPQVSPFAQWTKIAFFYCDGTMFSGMRKDPIQYKGSKIYFRANTIMKQHLKWLDVNYQLSTADKVVFSGASAGAIGAWMWANYVRDMIKTSNPYVLDVIVDSGLFVNRSTYQGVYEVDLMAQNQYKLANVDQDYILQPCVKKFASSPYKCLFLQNAFSSINTRTIFFNSPYDSQQLKYQMHVKCITDGASGGQTFKNCSPQEMNFIEANAQYRRKILSNIMMFTRFSSWSIACSNHVWTPFKKQWDNQKMQVPMISSHTAKDAVERFVFNRQRVSFIDNVKWPNNVPCAY